ncbi:YitT family protein [Amnibacterium flavum]|uniref:YitT family protein n=1 Tax=Amnibacterium flavum TaxID=2173173 RepID=A0A2V1HRR9_9MICO|nr:hypothetical protein [Amnibacterium flavum]PVZ95285.1 hypothetical protein DDQ50_01810 [Amnibacterium flavum]
MGSRHSVRIPTLLVGLALYGIADGMIVQAAIGVSPWAVLAQGISTQTGLLFGVVTNVIGALLLLLWIPLRQKPGVGTLLNVLIVGSMAQVAIWLIPAPEPIVGKVALFAGGLLLLAAATGIYVGADYGAGPRDGLMTGVSKRFGWPIWLSRSTIEITVLAAGWLLGGNVGVGTLAFAVFIGPLCHRTIPLLALRAPRTAAPAAG